MFKESEQSQLELFKDIKRPPKKYFFFKKKIGFQRHALTLLVYYENLVLFIIAFILLLIITFSFGIERGKRLRLLPQSFNRQVSNFAQKVQVTPYEEKKPTKQKAPEIETTAPPSVQYTDLTSKKPIQISTAAPSSYLIVAAFTNRSLAEKEKERLLKIGVSSFIAPSGRFYEIKIGPFTNKDDAINLQKRLKRFYKDCYIRRQIPA